MRPCQEHAAPIWLSVCGVPAETVSSPSQTFTGKQRSYRAPLPTLICVTDLPRLNSTRRDLSRQLPQILEEMWNLRRTLGDLAGELYASDLLGKSDDPAF